MCHGRRSFLLFLVPLYSIRTRQNKWFQEPKVFTLEHGGKMCERFREISHSISVSCIRLFLAASRAGFPPPIARAKARRAA
ncbi:hypothetical protein IE4803_CH00927 [Rhizobium etli bv. phaseoli str. IE4803]|nr:hypothetical protein IE4803_CH00927 [Rhizobium etli bv. phaseoli str. IE4803]